MILADSWVWIEVLADLPNADIYAPMLDAGVVVVPLVAAEVTRWFHRERGDMDLALVRAALMRGQCREMSMAVGMLAGELGVRHRLAMADAIIYAHAVVEDAELVTQDEHFRGLEGVRLFPSAVRSVPRRGR